VSDRCNAVGYKRNEADIRAVCELAEALRDTIVEYQVRTNLEEPHKAAESFTDAVNSSRSKRQYMTRTVD